MADPQQFPPLTADELDAVRRRSDGHMNGPSYTQADEDRARLLATLDAHYAAHPEAKERHQATARRIAAERYPEGSKLRELIEQGLVTPERRPDPEAIKAMRDMVRAAAEREDADGA